MKLKHVSRWHSKRSKIGNKIPFGVVLFLRLLVVDFGDIFLHRYKLDQINPRRSSSKHSCCKYKNMELI
jgi:hypothetical protein